MNPLTLAQQQAIDCQGNVLVKAGAGTGKTRTSVERCLDRICNGNDRVSLSRIMMVTFTEAAAAEIRKRVRSELERKAAQSPQDAWLSEQLALVDAACISTLHSFCLRLVRDHFYVLGIDPQITVLAEEQSRLLARETLDDVMDRHFTGETPLSNSIQNLILEQGRGTDESVREWVLCLHRYIQTLRNPAQWLEKELMTLQQPSPSLWGVWLRDGFKEWVELWLPVLQEQPPENSNAHQAAKVLQAAISLYEGLCPKSPSPCPLPQDGKAEIGKAESRNRVNGSGESLPAREQIAIALGQILEIDKTWPQKAKGRFRDPIKGCFEEAIFLHSVAAIKSENGVEPGANDPLVEDWNWTRHSMIALLLLTREFGDDFALAKRELGAVDFSDLEQFALSLLWDASTNQPSTIAAHWRSKLDLLFIDEYQDINAVQDAILIALGREGTLANRFLVGDVKQSIYRFRLANPHIFQRYAASWKADSSLGKVLSLNDNFRSHEAILGFINEFFSGLMRHEVGGVDYDEDAWLRFGMRETRLPMSMASEPALTEVVSSPSSQIRATGLPVGAEVTRLKNAGISKPASNESQSLLTSAPTLQKSLEPRVEFHLLLTSQKEPQDGAPESGGQNEDPSLSSLSATEKEARLAAKRLKELKQLPLLIWDSKLQGRRPVEWSDMVVLLRSPRAKAESYAKEFARLGVPLMAARGGFYGCAEVTDLLSLLQVLDNPLQDLPLLAVLRSPLVGLTIDELAAIRISHRQGYYWTALRRFHNERNNKQLEVGNGKVSRFLDRYVRWRSLTRQMSLSQCLEVILDETNYEASLLRQERYKQRAANIQRLLVMTRQFDQYQRQGLFRFLSFVEAQLEADADIEPASVASENAVRLTSIHQSKGLEFPVVVVADLAKRFNFGDAKGQIILDETYGLCSMVKPPISGRFYPSLPHWLASRRQRRETLGEEIRLLYVAMTRACDRLILIGAATQKNALETWPAEASNKLSVPQITSARSCLDWLGPWLPAHANQAWTTHGRTPLLEWRMYEENDPVLINTPEDNEWISSETNSKSPPLTNEQLRDLQLRFLWQYPGAITASEPAKASVSALRRRAIEADNDEAKQVFDFMDPSFEPSADVSGGVSSQELSPAEIGDAHHAFQQWVSLDQTNGVTELQQEALRMETSGLISADERHALDFAALAVFWGSEIGRLLCQHATQVHRELPFTARFSLAELVKLKIIPPLDANSGTILIIPNSSKTEDKASRSSDNEDRLTAALEGEFVVVQGIVDLAVISPSEIWLLDYKTDRIKSAGIAEKVQHYRPQIALYALALSRIYQLPVTRRWLYFFALGKSVAVDFDAV